MKFSMFFHIVLPVMVVLSTAAIINIVMMLVTVAVIS
jgi:hypothetical protein